MSDVSAWQVPPSEFWVTGKRAGANDIESNGREACKSKKAPIARSLFLILILAVTYVPASFPAQYHRPGKA